MAPLNGAEDPSEDSLNPDQFLNPDMTYRSIPFYSLNDWLEPAEIKRQMALFKEGGFGGAYLHSRIGILTEYLGDDWWKAMDAGVEAAAELEIEAWFYDEDKWPSGFAGGKTALASEDYHARSLVRMPKGAPLPETGTLLRADDAYQYVVYKMRMGSGWYNGTTWVDLMNPEMVQHFIGSSYAPYAERYREEMGTVAFGMFTDEPQIAPQTELVQHVGKMPFSPTIIEAFEREHGYDIRDHLASLFEEVGDFRKIRLHYHRTIARQFERSFSQQIGEFCREHGMIWTGHYWEENSLEKVKEGGGNLMIQYRHMDQPGIDHLGLNLNNLILKAKSVSSVANQYGFERRLSEIFGVSGQNMTFEDRKWLTDYHCALGINHFCPHLSLYSMKGERKRDYPPTLSPQQPYWPYNKLLEDYIARVVYATTRGDYVPELLILSPLESVYHVTEKADYDRWEDPFDAALRALQQAHRQFDIGDEQILADIAEVEGGSLVVGEMRYDVVVLPPMYEIRKTTIDLLTRFHDAGGQILVIDGFPVSCDGDSEAEALTAFSEIAKVVPSDQFIPALKEARSPLVEITGDGAGDVLMYYRSLEDDSALVQLANSSRLESAHVQVSLAQEINEPLVWDPASGQALKIDPEADGTYVLELAPAQSLILSSGEIFAQDREHLRTYRLSDEGETELTLRGEWTGRRLDPNAITLDFARYSTDGGETFSEPEPVIGIHERFTHNPYNGTLHLNFEFTVDAKLEETRLVVEQPDIYDAITINGKSVSFDGEAFYCDAEFRVSETNIAPHMKKGVNTVSLVVDYKAPIPASLDAVERYGTEIESIYLIGDFAVTAEVSKKPLPETQRDRIEYLPRQGIHRFSEFTLAGEKDRFSGDLVPQGYPFYAGRFALDQTFVMSDIDPERRYFLTFPKTETTVIDVSLNGEELGAVAWSPWEIEITDALRKGENAVTVTLINSLRNLLGPHHHRDGELTEVGPVSFTGAIRWPDFGPGEADWYDVRLEGEPGKWRDDYFMVPFGVLETPVIVSRKR